ncbi:H+transporting two-sector ATPase alpha/beta subunit central region [Desulfarculus baarsii DSM 2075]|uniref:V-type ATP synthase alpha chain n=1 Tax=Desulfarculus baarsii (strain ATCC 33931 / DSM 2075 / LMG 7858 / VKM B-1802 / 2st14) TaxID=644282 RepID=E1QGX1_DESB2|nr:V-type ATP synthase subunit A [Desulfarculus baarsii]ADK84814.1 H+transporting two-sector ATPase alpha/beta subunit central region [Desulfarculus baarsii DSM 2075]
MNATGKVLAAYGNLVTVQFDSNVRQNEVAYIVTADGRMKSEVIRVRGDQCYAQVFEDTRGIKVGDAVEFTGDLLVVELGPGILQQIYDGLQNPLPKLSEATGLFLKRGVYIDPLDRQVKWDFTPKAKVGDVVGAGDMLGSVPEGKFEHKIFVPFNFIGKAKIVEMAAKGDYTVVDTIAVVEDQSGARQNLCMMQRWPIKIALKDYEERLLPVEPLVTGCRIIDSFYPVAKGGTACIPGPFGSGKTVLQQIISRYADVDVIIVAACGERAGEVVETLREFPHLEDPYTGRTLMERTVIICNTSSMPVAAREASIYTAITIGEYYRQMGLDVLLLADSTSRWAQALREMSGRLEEIPGEEAFPAYLQSRIAEFYERAGFVRLKSGETGSVSVIGTVSPAGGNFEEPVTQGTLAVVGAFLGLTWARSNARRFPAIDPLISWSKYLDQMRDSLDKLDPAWIASVAKAQRMIFDGNEIKKRMDVVGEEGTSISDFIIYLKAEFLDSVYLQQNAFDKVDAYNTMERQVYTFKKVLELMDKEIKVTDKDEARDLFFRLAALFKNMNASAMQSEEFAKFESQINDFIGS